MYIRFRINDYDTNIIETDTKFNEINIISSLRINISLLKSTA